MYVYSETERHTPEQVQENLDEFKVITHNGFLDLWWSRFEEIRHIQPTKDTAVRKQLLRSLRSRP